MIGKTFLLKKEDIKREWHHIDASGQILGRLSTRISLLLRGKAKRNFTPHTDGGDFVVVTNAAKIKITGNKALQKHHFRHSGYPGGVTLIPYGFFMEKYPARVLQLSVKGMLPKSRTRKRLLKRLKVFAGNDNRFARLTTKGQNNG